MFDSIEKLADCHKFYELKKSYNPSNSFAINNNNLRIDILNNIEKEAPQLYKF